MGLPGKRKSGPLTHPALSRRSVLVPHLSRGRCERVVTSGLDPHTGSVPSWEDGSQAGGHVDIDIPLTAEDRKRLTQALGPSWNADDVAILLARAGASEILALATGRTAVENETL